MMTFLPIVKDRSPRIRIKGRTRRTIVSQIVVVVDEDGDGGGNGYPFSYRY